MKLILSLIAVAILAGCASKPVIIRVKNCQPLGDGLYDCEEIPKRDMDRPGRRQ